MTAAVVIPGLSLRDYSRLPDRRGWGPPCIAPRVTIRLTEAAVTVDARAAELTGLIMRANEKQGYRYRRADTGAYNCRHIGSNPALPWSIHAWALAVDSNWQTNPMTRPLRTDRPRWELDRWNRFGFAWGGDYTGGTDPDAMHTEQMGTPAQVAQLTVIARRELQPIIDGLSTIPTIPTQPQEDDDMLFMLQVRDGDRKGQLLVCGPGFAQPLGPGPAAAEDDMELRSREKLRVFTLSQELVDRIVADLRAG